MSSISRPKPAVTADLITFDNEITSCGNNLSEIQKLFDPLIAGSSGCPYPPLPKNTFHLIHQEQPPKVPPKPTHPWNTPVPHRNLSCPLNIIENACDGGSLVQNKPPLRTAEEHDDVTNFLSIFMPSTDVDKRRRADTVQSPVPYYGFKLPPYISEQDDQYNYPAEKESQTTEPDVQNVVQKRIPPRPCESPFISNSHTSAEVKNFVEAVESIRSQKQYAFNSSELGDKSDLTLDESFASRSSLDVRQNRNDGWVYNEVYGNLVSNPSGSNRCSLTGVTKVCNAPLWKTKTGARNVSHIAPLPVTTPQLDGEAPSHWKNPTRWTIPQIEVRIIAHLEDSKKRSTIYDEPRLSKENVNGNSILEIESNPPITPKVSAAPRLRLTCDPNSTLVSELIMEALANDLIPSRSNLNANEFQLRLHGRAELLHPDARLCDCSQVQLCHRLDRPLRLILEPKRLTDSCSCLEPDTQDAFSPQIPTDSSHRLPSIEEVSISYGIFQNAVDKVRASLTKNNALVDVETWLNELQCVNTSLEQSVKAVFAAVCHGIAFTDVLNALVSVQVCIMECVKELGLDNQTTNLKNCTTEGWFASFRRHRMGSVSSPLSISPGRSCSMTNKRALKCRIPECMQNKLSRALIRLELALLRQIKVFLDWRQVGLRINPALLIRLEREATDHSRSQIRQSERPQGVILYPESADTPHIKATLDSLQQGEEEKEVKSSADCVDPFVVGLIAIHRAPRNSQISPFSPGPNSSQSTSPSAGKPTNPRYSSDFHFCVRLSLTYAGRPLGKIYPHDSAGYGPEISGPGLSTSERDTFISDPGRYQTIQTGFPKVLLFDQWFKFPGFSIDQLPRETLLALSLFSCKKYSSENVEVDGVLVGWVNIPLFDPEGRLIQNNVVAGLWPPSEVMHPYRPTWTQSNHSIDCPVVQLCFPEYQFQIQYPVIETDPNYAKSLPTHFSALNAEAKDSVLNAERALFLKVLSPELTEASISQCLTSYSAAASASRRHSRQRKSSTMTIPPLRLGALNNINCPTVVTITSSQAVNSQSQNASGQAFTDLDRISCTLPSPPPIAVEVLWNLRPCLRDMPTATVALLSSVLVTWPQEACNNSTRNSTWSWTRLLRDIYSLLSSCTSPTPGLALRLLAPDVPDQGIRHWAVRSLALLPPDILLFYLPQALEAINHDTYLDYSGLASLLLYRAATSMRFANAMYWEITSAVNQSVASSPTGPPSTVPINWRFRRFLLLKAALSWLSGRRLRLAWRRQEEVMNQLFSTAVSVKEAKPTPGTREEILYRHLRSLMNWLSEDSRRSWLPDLQTPSSNVAKPQEPKPVTLIEFEDNQPKNERVTSPTPSSCSTARTNLSCVSLSYYDVGLRMPYNPGLLTQRIDVSACTYFTSFTCPLRLVFHALDTRSEPIMVMFKAGDDLRLDGLISQMTFLMDRIWLDNGMDLRMINFRIVPTGDHKGLVELVSECCTLRQIQQQGGGLTGPFKESVITTWLQSQNTTELDYKRALDNFLRSLAGCCVTTYMLGVGDRHNDNIMIRYSGHLFHVDFSKVFGNVQTFAGIKRDRVPFVLTQDMLHVLQTYSREISDDNLLGSAGSPNNPNARYPNVHPEGVQIFIDYCCEAYNLIRHHSYAFLAILELGLSMNIPGVNLDSVRYVMRALRLDLNDQQASQHFTELIRKSLQSKIPALNFFVHGLAQAKQGGYSNGTGMASPTGSLASHASSSRLERMDLNRAFDTSTTTPGLPCRPGHLASGQSLSFSPKSFSFSADEKINAVVVEVAVKKKCSDKHTDYYFPMSVWWQNCRVPTRIYRRISDLNELCALLLNAFPGLPALLTITHTLNTVNSNPPASVKTQNAVQTLIDTILEEDESVSKSDLVCTFFHSVLFDEKFAAEDSAHLMASGAQASFWTPTPSADLGILSDDKTTVAELTAPLLTLEVANVLYSDSAHETMTSRTTAPEGVPALQIQLSLSENSQRLDMLVKHGRSLSIPGSTEPPDVYVKVYLLSSRRRKSTKRKTGIVRHSNSPSFNASFSYELCQQDVLAGFLEVSAWHAVNLGENVSLGQAYIQLRTLRPGQCVTKWYTLSADWITA